MLEASLQNMEGSAAITEEITSLFEKLNWLLFRLIRLLIYPYHFLSNDK